MYEVRRVLESYSWHRGRERSEKLYDGDVSGERAGVESDLLAKKMDFGVFPRLGQQDDAYEKDFL